MRAGQRAQQRNGVGDIVPSPVNGLPGGVDLTLSELQDMAARQQQQIEHQQQVLVAKEQRLKYLKQQDQRQQHIIAEGDRLKKLRDRVESQEMKLKKLRALRGEVDKHRNTNGMLNTELESVKALFTEKEKELVMAVAKVEELTRQLERIRHDRSSAKNGTQSAAALELDKLRKELMIRNKLNEQQNSKLNKHREMLNQRKEEISKMDNRIHELQERLKKKRAQQAEQRKNLDNKKLDANHNPRPSNVAQVEPYIQLRKSPEAVQSEADLKSNFAKQDPKYQTLPPNTKLTSPTKSDNEQNNVVKKQEPKPPERPPRVEYGGSNGPVTSSQVSESVIKAAQRYQPAPSATSGGQPKKPPPPPRSANTGLSHFTPRPYGSTYSSSVLTNRTQNQGLSNGPTVNVQEEIRQGGSGQSSPASSEGSQNGRNDPTKESQNTSQSNGGPPSRRLPPPPPPPSHTKDIPTQPKSEDQTDSSRPLRKPQEAVFDSNGRPNHVNGTTGNSVKQMDSNGASNPMKTINFASKNQIANTYMGRLKSNTLQKYQQNMDMIYQHLARGDESEKSKQDKSESDKNRAPNGQKPAVSEPQSQHSHSLDHIHSFNHSNQDHQYPDLTSDKISHNRPTKKIHRRPSDSSDSEEMARLLHKHVDREHKNHILNNTQATSFIGGVPEDVPVDSMGNLMEDFDKEEDKNDQPLNSPEVVNTEVVPRKKTNLRSQHSRGSGNRVSFDPLALLLDASLEGEVEMVKRCATQVANVSEPNDEGITALHNAICAGHYEIVTFLVEFGCDVNSPDSDGWTPLHCAASCNNIQMVIFLVEHGACIFATTISDHETAAEKCEEDEEGFDGCSDYLYSVQEKLGILNGGVVYAVFDYEAKHDDELSFRLNEEITVLRKGDEQEKEWWWSRVGDKEGYIPRNLLGLYPRVLPRNRSEEN
ncbi:apoptosis-stimulating of p53 protein 2-like isoform X6 [Crassostrea virginica]